MTQREKELARALERMQEKVSALERQLADVSRDPVTKETPNLNEASEEPRSTARESMSDVVVDTNPYSRLMALERMGIVENYRVMYCQIKHCMFHVNTHCRWFDNSPWPLWAWVAWAVSRRKC